MRKTALGSVAMAITLVVGSLSLVACTTTGSNTSDAPRADSTSLNTRADAALQRLYQSAPGSQEMVRRAKGVLIFPSVIGGSFVVGVEHGRGVLRVGGRNRGEYSTTAASIGWQAGGQSRAVIYVFNTQEALDKFLNGDGWSVGADATVAAGRVGANGNVDTTTSQAPVTSYVLTNAGLEAGVSLQGTKITKVVQ